jgi:hypothetical protein
MSNCPPLEQLECLLSEQLAEPERGAVEAHVEGCAACQQALGRMAGGPADRSGERPAAGGRPARQPLGTALLHWLEEALVGAPAFLVQVGTPPLAATPSKESASQATDVWWSLASPSPPRASASPQPVSVRRWSATGKSPPGSTRRRTNGRDKQAETADQRCRSISRAAFQPAAPMTPPPGCAAAPHR